MLVKISSNTILLDKRFSETENAFIWFKGYFFNNNKLIRGEDAVSFFNSNTPTIELISQLNGVFSLLYKSKQTENIIIANDRYGFGQLFYTNCQNELVIDDNFEHITSHCNKSEIDTASLHEFLAYRYISGKYTLLKEVYCIEPASYYEIEANIPNPELRRTEYYCFKHSDKQLPDSKAEAKNASIVADIIKKYQFAQSNKTVGINMTGGLDSRLLLCSLIQSGVAPSQIKAFTFGSKDCEDQRIASEIASIAAIEHRTKIFPDDFSDFFNPSEIKKHVSKIGHFTYYFQSYGCSSLLPFYHDIDFLLTGADGFVIGNLFNNRMPNMCTKESAINYILEQNASMLSLQEIESITGDDTENIKQNLLSRLDNTFTVTDDDYMSAIIDWTIKNRLRKYTVSIHEILNQNCTALYPFYDYDFMDFMASLSFKQLQNQRTYINSIYKNVFTGRFHSMKDITVDQRGVFQHKENNFMENPPKKNILTKLRQRFFPTGDKNYSYPIYGTFLQNKKKFMANIFEIIEGSKVMDGTQIKKLVKKKQRNERFFRYGLLVILSVRIFERYNLRQTK